jgi:hypothetical protein
MKKYIAKSILAAAGGLSLLTACSDTLDADKYFDDRVTLESVFTSVNQTNGWLAQAFSYLKSDLADCITKEQNGVGWHCFADDMYFGDRDANRGDGYSITDSYNSFKQGDYSETYGQNAWINAYRGIYQASVFIHNVDMNYNLTEEQRTDLKGQARFVRAYFYWLLLRRYGPVPIMPDEGADYTLSYDELSIPRSTYEECAEHIASEMIQAANELSSWSRFVGNTDSESAIRPTKGAALAVRALVYLYAASPLANGQLQNGTHPSGISDAFAKSLVNQDGTPLLSLTYDESKWARAAAALRDVIECPANYELYHSGVYTTDNKQTGYPKTITPPDDGDFSEKNWPDGWADIDPYISYRDFFNGVVGLDNTEIIFTRGFNTSSGRHSSIDGFVTHELPNSLFGFNCHGLTQKLVDAYYMNDGTDVPGKDSEMNGGDGSERRTDWTTSRGDNAYTKYPPLGQGVSMQYANREPRFYATVAFNGSYWWDACPDRSNKYMQVFYWRGTNTTSTSSGSTTTENNGYTNGSYYLRTGIGCKKWVNPSDYRTIRDGGDYDHITRKWEPAIRYADILLMYAEALNELTASYTVASWDGSTTYTISRDVTEMKRGIRPVRCRAGVPDYPASVYGDQVAMRDKIKRERFIEFVGEGKRYYDLRRWMDAAVEEAKPIYGCNVMMTNKQQDEFQRVVPIYNLPTVFSDKMYFWPISFDELKRNKSLVQNPGWQYYD